MNREIRRAGLETKWARLIQQCQTSSLTIKAFAFQNRVGQGSLYIWAKKLGMSLKHQSQAGIGFIELGTLPSKMSMPEAVDSYPIEMTVSHLTIKAEMPLVRIVELVKALG